MQQRVPFNKWPRWAKLIGRLSIESDTGLGDTVERIIGPTNSHKFKVWFKATFGIDCGCDGRKEEWNQVFKY